MSRKSNTETRRVMIVAAMLVVIAKHGYEKTTIQMIAKEAGIAPGLIHYHFKSKQEILVALVKHIAGFAQQRFLTLVDDTDQALERLFAYLQARLGLGDGAAPDMVAAWVMIGAEAVHQSEVREVYREAIAAELSMLSGLLRDCLAAEQRDVPAATHIAAGLLAMTEGAFQIASAAPAVMPVGYAAEVAMTFAKLSIAAS